MRMCFAGYGKREFAATDASLKFDPREEFAGRRPGFVFRMGGQGLGYYEDAYQQRKQEETTEAAASVVEAGEGKGL